MIHVFCLHLTLSSLPCGLCFPCPLSPTEHLVGGKITCASMQFTQNITKIMSIKHTFSKNTQTWQNKWKLTYSFSTCACENMKKKKHFKLFEPQRTVFYVSSVTYNSQNAHKTKWRFRLHSICPFIWFQLFSLILFSLLHFQHLLFMYECVHLVQQVRAHRSFSVCVNVCVAVGAGRWRRGRWGAKLTERDHFTCLRRRFHR